jgi:hypothetical protein
MPVGEQPSQDPSVVSSIAMGVLTDGEIASVDFDGRQAAWVDGHSLVWLVDGVNYNVGGLDLTLEQAMEIGRSLQ